MSWLGGDTIFSFLHRLSQIREYLNNSLQIAQKNAGMADIDVDRYQGPLREATPSGHVGFDSLPDQVVNKATGAGFCFNILCVGETGIGKR